MIINVYPSLLLMVQPERHRHEETHCMMLLGSGLKQLLGLSKYSK